MPAVVEEGDPRAGAIPEPSDFIRFAQELHGESDRGMALIGTAYLDDRLGQLIEGYLTPDAASGRLLWEGNAPVGAFSARILLTHALGLISQKERDEMNMLRKIRNLFAHDYKVQMGDRVVTDTMANFRELTNVVWSDMATLLNVEFAETPRDRFFHAVMRLAQQLDTRRWVIENDALRLKAIDWREHYF